MIGGRRASSTTFQAVEDVSGSPHDDEVRTLGNALTRRSFSASLITTMLATVLPPWRQGVRAAETTADDGLAKALARIEAGSGGRLGVTFRDTGSGRLSGHRSNERFPLCSTFKVLACGAVLARVDAGREDLHRRIVFEPRDVVTYSPVTQDRAGRDGMTLAELCEAALTQSDNTAGNLILASLGGPSAVTTFARSLGDASTRLDRIETDLNEATPGDLRDTTTPDAMAHDLQSLVVGDHLSVRSRDQLTTWLVSNQTGGAKLRAGLPQDWRVGDKTGGGDQGTTNDVAVVWPPGRKPLIVCVFLTETTASFADRNATIAAVGRAIATTLQG